MGAPTGKSGEPLVRGEEKKPFKVHDGKVPMARHEAQAEVPAHRESSDHIVRGEEKMPPNVHDGKVSMARHEARSDTPPQKSNEHLARREEADTPPRKGNEHSARHETNVDVPLPKNNDRLSRHEAKVNEPPKKTVAAGPKLRSQRGESASAEIVDFAVTADGTSTDISSSMRSTPTVASAREVSPTSLVRGETAIETPLTQKAKGPMTRKQSQ